VREEHFSISPHPDLWLKSIFLFFLIALITTWLTFEKIPFLAFLFSIAFLLGVGVADRVLLHMGGWAVSRDLKRGIPSKNISAHFPGTEGKGSLYLVAHYDSKSQSLSITFRTGFLILGCAAGGVFNFWIWIHLLRKWIEGDGFPVPLIIQGCFFLSVFLNLILLLSKMGDESDGALDNASGVGVLLETARRWASKNLKDVFLHFVFTGAEETGLLGSQMFLKSHGEKMVGDKVFVINLDGVGQKGKLSVYSSGEAGKKWLRQVGGIAAKKGIRIRRQPLLKGIWMDHLPFCHFGISAISLSGIGREGWHIHTSRDKLNLVQEEGLAEIEELLEGVIESFEIE
jgi:hypothetical protein